MTPRSSRWRQCICHTGKSWICLRVAGHCQHSRKRIYMYLSMPGFEVLKVWSFRFLENDHASSVLWCFLTHVFLLHCVSAVLFWKILRLSGLCSHIEDAVLAHVVKGHPINCRPSLYFHSDPCFSFGSHLCVLSMYKRTQFVFAYYEGTHSMYLHSMNTQCICILSAHAAPYRGIWHQHRVCSSLAKTSQNSEKPWQLWRRGERGCTFTVLQSWWRPWTSFGNCRSPWFPAVSWQKQKSISPGTLDIRGIYVSWIDPILLSIAQDTQLLWEQSFIEHLEITYCAALVYGRLYK